MGEIFRETPVIKRNFRKIILSLCLFVLFSVLGAADAQAAVLSLSPSGGTFETGSTFDVSIFLNTEEEIINTVEVSLSFPPDKLQLVSPAIGQSIIAIWTAPPRYDNQNGRIDLQGGIPGGINVSKGLVMRLTFRVKSVGTAALRFLDNSKVLLNDGKGTESLRNTINGVYSLVLPPPAGPIVSSETHPDSSIWYNNPNVVLRWTVEPEVDGYSYILNKEPTDIPDDISEGTKTSIIYQNVGDGINYFHIKASKEGRWGGVTHFSIQIDTTPPAEFPIEIIPAKKTTRKQPVIQFSTTDAFSGISHYELKIVPLKVNSSLNPSAQPLFIEVESPYIPSPLELGTYDIIVRAYDQAQNYREITQHCAIITAVFQIISGKGIEIKNVLLIPWKWFWGFSLLVLIILSYIGWRIRRWHHRVHFRQSQKELPEYIKKQLEELRKYRERYGSKTLTILFLIFAGALLSFFSQSVFAQQPELAPPIITTVSTNVSNEEIFYLGGKTESPQTQIILYLQNIQTGETTSQTLASDNRGDWLYRHDRFLSTGNYLLWAQSKIGDKMSPPTPQTKITVYPIAIQFGASRISYAALYLVLIILLSLILIGLIGYIVFHSYHGRRRHLIFLKEIKEAEESVRRGFAVLRRDIQAELAVIQKAKLIKELSEEEQKTAAQLLRDLEQVERYIGKEVWDVEKVDYLE